MLDDKTGHAARGSYEGNSDASIAAGVLLTLENSTSAVTGVTLDGLDHMLGSGQARKSGSWVKKKSGDSAL
jgi:hypothetical protein